VIRPLLELLLNIAALAALIFWLWTRERSDLRSTIAAVLAVAGALVFFDGFRLAVLEESRARYGRVGSGVVEDLQSSVGDEEIFRLVQTLSGDAWVVSYRYPCAGGTEICREREYVTKDLWSRLHIGQSINVRQSVDETRTARLDDNPQRGLALVKVAVACVLLAIAGLLSGQLTLFRRQKYIEADAVVTSVERVQYGDETRWKVRFAYFDLADNAQDSVDEVNDPSWKSGAAGRAVYRPKTPDLATLRPRTPESG
jgi:hypothetical protein